MIWNDLAEFLFYKRKGTFWIGIEGYPFKESQLLDKSLSKQSFTN